MSVLCTIFLNIEEKKLHVINEQTIELSLLRSGRKFYETNKNVNLYVKNYSISWKKYLFDFILNVQYEEKNLKNNNENNIMTVWQYE